MSLLDQLSSQVGDRSEYSNRKVAIRCLADRALLKEIARGFRTEDAALWGDCAEIFTNVAEQHPDWIVRYAATLAPLLSHPTTRVRWEAMHAFALMAPFAPKVIAPLLPQLTQMILEDSSVIVRDHAIDAIACYARTSRPAAQRTLPVLKQALTAWEGKQAGHALTGLANVAAAAPELTPEVRALGESFLDHRRPVVRRAARALFKAMGLNPSSSPARRGAKRGPTR